MVSLPPLSILSLTVKGVTKSTSIKASDIKSITFFPNPTKGVIEIQNAEWVEKLDVYDLHGRLQHSFLGKNIRQIDVSNLPKGMYLVVFHAQEGKVVRKVVKW